MISEMGFVFIVLAVTTVCFVIPRFRSDLVAVCSLLALTVTGLLTVPEALAGFSNSVVIMIAALFVVGEGIFQTGLAQRAGQVLAKLTGNSEFRLMFLMMVLVALLGAFMSNTGTVAILMPIVVSLCLQMRMHPSKVLMSLAFLSSMGGTLTLIGTAPNLIASEILQEYGYGALSFFDFTGIGVIVLAVGFAFLYGVGRKWLDRPIGGTDTKSDRFDGSVLLDEYEASVYVHALRIPTAHSVNGRALKELRWPERYGVTILEVLRRDAAGGRFRFPARPGFHKMTAGPHLRLQEGDVIIAYGKRSDVERLAEVESLAVIHANGSIDSGGPAVASDANDAGGIKAHWLRPENARLAEVILTPRSRLINRTIHEVGFREKYGLTVLAIMPAQKAPKLPSPGEKLHYGDSLLVHGKWKDIDLLAGEKSDTVVLRHAPTSEAEKADPVRQWIAAFILLGMIVTLAFEWLPTVVATIAAAILMLLSGCIRQTDHAYRSIHWQTVILIACMLPLATALDKTGGVSFFAESLVTGLGSFGPLVVMVGLYAVTSLLGLFISNTATAVLPLPVAVMTAEQLAVSPLPLVMAVAYSASMSFATPVSTPPNAMVMAAGKYRFFDFVKVGLPLQVIVGVTIILLLPLFFPF